jgi:hypothetical protein
MRQLPDWIDGFMEYTKKSESPKSYRTWTAISVIAAALQRKCFINWGTSLTFYPNLYIVLVGPSGVRKSSAMGPGLDILQEIPNITVAPQATTLQALIRRLKHTNYTDVDLLTGKQQFHASISIFSKEFTVFLGYNNQAMIAALCDWYDCESKWSYETVSRDQEEIIGVWVNLLGATTPTLIQASLPTEAIGGGLTSRIIFIFEERKGQTVIIPMQTEEEVMLGEVLKSDLEKIRMMTGSFQVTEGFINAWTEWYTNADANPPFSDEKLNGYITRRPTHVMKLSMIMSASRKDGPSMCITADDMNRAVSILTEAELNMTKVFSGVGMSPVSSILYRVLTFIISNKHLEIPMSTIVTRFCSDIDKRGMDGIISTLKSMRVVNEIERPNGSFLKYIGNDNGLGQNFTQAQIRDSMSNEI